MNIIVAVDQNWGIGCGGQLLVRNPGDMKYFRSTTIGKVVVMGRKTLESFPGKKPLKDRVNVVLTRDYAYRADGAVVCHKLEEALEYLKQYRTEDVFIIGGQSIYEQLLPFCDTAYVTYNEVSYPADTYFPNLDENPGWQVKMSRKVQEQGGFDYEFRIYVRSIGA